MPVWNRFCLVKVLILNRKWYTTLYHPQRSGKSVCLNPTLQDSHLGARNSRLMAAACRQYGLDLQPNCLKGCNYLMVVLWLYHLNPPMGWLGDPLGTSGDPPDSCLWCFPLSAHLLIFSFPELRSCSVFLSSSLTSFSSILDHLSVFPSLFLFSLLFHFSSN